MDTLKLIALDKEDLEVVSAHLQDAVVRVEDIIWRPSEHRLVIGLNRFDWESASAENPAWQRRRAALRFDRVVSFRARNVSSADKDKVLNLLALEFAETSPPAGTVTLVFSGDVALRLDVECVETEFVDLGPVWATSCCPDHEHNADMSGPNCPDTNSPDPDSAKTRPA
ncbi:MAG: DUF2948 family protein [Pseudorhodoplanes sp.]|nr:hypothetical protein [Pseudorhodoplanes sp.]MBW7947738.1 DUF2948 family protein [Pseudorhodoplanes sp.]GIK79546.1 MAG: hypothetical protein BroJett024_06510 [Alphaproteobacteria bacterium]